MNLSVLCTKIILITYMALWSATRLFALMGIASTSLGNFFSWGILWYEDPPLLPHRKHFFWLALFILTKVFAISVAVLFDAWGPSGLSLCSNGLLGTDGAFFFVGMDCIVSNLFRLDDSKKTKQNNWASQQFIRLGQTQPRNQGYGWYSAVSSFFLYSRCFVGMGK